MTEPQSKRGATEIRGISAAETVPMRHEILRPGRTVEAAHFPGDDEPTTQHFGAFGEGRLVGIVSLFRAGLPEEPGPRAIQLRGMATAPEARARGHGRALVLRSIDFTREAGAEILWCNARKTAVGFYEKLGFEIVGGEFEVPEIGPHFRMWLRV